MICCRGRAHSKIAGIVSAEVASQKAAHVTPAVSILRCIGNGVHNRVVETLQEVWRPEGPQNNGVIAFWQHFFFAGGRTLAGRKMEALLLKMDRRSLKRRIAMSGALCHIASRMYAPFISPSCCWQWTGEKQRSFAYCPPCRSMKLRC